jgi:hypothetical protein
MFWTARMIAGVAPANRVILLLIVCKLLPVVDHGESSLISRAALSCVLGNLNAVLNFG